ncbi:MAG: PEGA domain-containing protein [Gemmatimonadota bacterium]
MPRKSKVFYGREDDFAFVHRRLVAEKEGIILLFVGGRRSGKTSILYQILGGRLGPEFLPVFVDMQAFLGLTGDGDFLGRLARVTIEGAGDERLTPEYYDFAAGNPLLAFDRLLDDVAQVFPGRRLLFLVDEAELLRNHVRDGVIGQAVLTYLSSILESRGVSFCFTGSQGLASGEETEWRRLLGKGDIRDITFLSKRDTLRLAQEPLEEAVEYGEGVLDAVYTLTFGQPFYAQVLYTNIVDYLNGMQRYRFEMADLDEVVRTLVANPPPHLVYDWEQFSDQQQLVLSLLSEATQKAHQPVPVDALVDRIRESNYPIDLSAETMHQVLDGLDERKVIDRDEGGGYHFLVDLIRLWIRRHRSIWRLVEEAGPAHPRRGRIVAAAAAVVAAGALGVALLWPRAPAPNAAGTPPAMSLRDGSLTVQPHPEGARIEVRGPLESADPDTHPVDTTPILIPELRPGAYAVEVRHPDYALVVDTHQVAAGATEMVLPHLQRLTGQLSVQVRPVSAALQIRGDNGRFDSTMMGPVEALTLSTGQYTVRATHPGYIYQELEVTVAADAACRLPLTLRANTGRLAVQSEPPGAEVWLDGEPTGKRTPVLLDSLPVATHGLELRLPDYVSAETTCRVWLGETDSVALTLALKPATLQLITDPPGARVYIDGVEQPAVTPGSYAVAARRHQVRFERDGYDEQVVEYDVGPGQERRFVVSLAPQYGYVQVLWPYTGTLFDGDQQVRDGTLGYVRLTVGEHRLRLRGRDEVKVVPVVKDDTTRIQWE